MLGFSLPELGEHSLNGLDGRQEKSEGQVVFIYTAHFLKTKVLHNKSAESAYILRIAYTLLHTRYLSLLLLLIIIMTITITIILII